MRGGGRKEAVNWRMGRYYTGMYMADGQILYSCILYMADEQILHGRYMADGQEILWSGGRDAPSVGQCGVHCVLVSVHCLNVDNVELAACSMCGVHSSEDREVTPQLLGSSLHLTPQPAPSPILPHWNPTDGTLALRCTDSVLLL